MQHLNRRIYFKMLIHLTIIHLSHHINGKSEGKYTALASYAIYIWHCLSKLISTDVTVSCI